MKVILLALALLFVSSAGRTDDSPSLEKLKPLANAEQRFADKVLVYFWASWCPDCREKLSGPLQKIQHDFPAVSVITVNSDREAAKGLSYAESEKLKLPVYRDDDRSLTRALKLFAVPAWAVLERKTTGEWAVRTASTGADVQAIEAELVGKQ